MAVLLSGVIKYLASYSKALLNHKHLLDNRRLDDNAHVLLNGSGEAGEIRDF